MPKISAVIITYNEERNIARCLESLQKVADEVIVVDSFSTDKTKDICSSFKVKFIEKEWEGYSTTKNYANSLARYDYILSIDADEALSPELIKSALKFKNDSNPMPAYRLNRLTNYCGKWIRHGSWYPDRKIRLWKNGIAQWEGDLHEQLKFNNIVYIGQLSGKLYHYSFYSISQHVTQINRFTDIASETDFNKDKHAGLLKIYFMPKWKFFRDYFLKLGIIDGYYGYIVCKLSAHAKFLKYTKLRQKLNNANK